MKISRASTQQTGFTLMELIVVVAIIGIIAVYSAPTVGQIVKGSNLNQAASMLTDQLRLARDTSIAQNCRVEVRFYQYGDPEMPGENPAVPSTGRFRALQAFQVTGGINAEVMLPLDKVQKIPNSVCIYCTDQSHPGATETYSSILSTTLRNVPVTTPSAANGDLPMSLSVSNGTPVGMNYVYIPFRFNPGGSTNLPWVATGSNPPTWFITVCNMNDTDGKGGGYLNNKIPVNFFCLQIDPVSGSTKPFRPMIQ